MASAAMARDLDPALVAQARGEWEATGHGGKSTVLKAWAARLGVSFQTLYRALPPEAKGARARAKGSRKIQGIEEAARVVARLKVMPPEHRGTVTTPNAVANAIANGLLPQGFGEVHVSTFDRVIRELGLSPRRRRICRFQAGEPNELHHVDASTSNCFFIARRLPDGEFVLKLHKGTKDYKNKPIPVDGLRPWIYGLTDDHSGVHCCRYVAAKGESAEHNMDFLCWAWWQRPEKLLFGVPQKIKGDHGPMMESPQAKDFFARLDVEIDPSGVLCKEAHGKIERPWRTLWKAFELNFFMDSHWKKFEIPLGELNGRLTHYSADYNTWPHRYEREISRRQAWERISLSGGVTILPDDALQTIARQYERTVDQSGVFWIDNVPYEIKDLHDAKVRVYLGVYDKRMVAQDLRTGTKYPVEEFKPNALGEFTAAPHSDYQKVRAEATETEGITNRLHTDAMAALPENVVRIPTRVKETRALENPLDTDRYPGVAAALREFQALAGFVLDREARAEVAALLAENGLSRRFVAELAAEVERERAEAMG